MSQDPPEPCVLHVLSGNGAGQRAEFVLDSGDTFVIGRDPAAVDLVVPDGHVSGRHAVIERDESGQLCVRDLKSTNGTRVSRDGVVRDTGDRALPLREHERIAIGDADQSVVLEFFASPAIEKREEESRVVALTHIGRVEDIEGTLTADPGLLQTMYAGFKRMGQELDLGSVVDAAVALVFELLPAATHVTVALDSQASSEGDETRFVPLTCISRDGKAETPRPLSNWLRKRILESGSGLLAADAAAELEDSKSLQQQSLASLIAVPLWIGEGVIGMVRIDRRADAADLGEPTIFTQTDLELAMIVASQMAVALRHARLYQKLQVSEEKLRSENRFLKTREARETTEMVGESEPMRSVIDLIEKVQRTSVPVCIVGETGTGKELVARRIHHGSQRSSKLFVAQNCAALPEELLESELFGHERGAFTGADQKKKGLFEIADGGTIFLDEVAETTPAMQAKLLRVLQEGEVRPVGAVKTHRVDVRVLSATNRNLEEEVADGRFREDLYYRLNVFPVRLPPLRDRGDDVALLARHFMEKYALEFGRTPLTFAQSALDVMKAYKWPGNIRELQNEIQRLIITAAGEIVVSQDLSPRIRIVEKILGAADDDPEKPLKERMNNVERYILIEALREHDNNKTQTAKTLGITREGLHKKLKRLGV